MNKSVENYRSTWSPNPTVALLAWLLSLGLAAGVVALFLRGDKPGALLAAAAVVGAVTAGCYTSFARPRLAASEIGIRVRTFGGSYELAWDEVTIRTFTTHRFGRPSHTLEIDAGEQPPHLVVFGKFELAQDPADVVDVLNDLRRHA